MAFRANASIPRLLSAGILALALVCGLPPAASAQSTRPVAADVDGAAAALRDARDPARLVAAARSLARADTDRAWDALAAALEDEGFLARLDADAPYAKPGRMHLRVGVVLDEVAAAGTPRAQAVLVKAASSPLYQPFHFDRAHEERHDAALAAFSRIVAPTPESIAYLLPLAKQGAAETVVVINALMAMESPLAERALEAIFLSKDFDDFHKTAYLQDLVLYHRNSPHVVHLYHRLLTTPTAAADPELRKWLALTLFAWDPNWYPIDFALSPPSYSDASDEALREMLEAADAAGKLQLPDDVSEAVAGTKALIQHILASRRRQAKPGDTVGAGDATGAGRPSSA